MSQSKLYFVCPVRNVSDTTMKLLDECVAEFERNGWQVHCPPRDVDQADPIGTAICEAHFKAMSECEIVAVYWDPKSNGSHFDLGMAYALGKKVILVQEI